MAVLYSVYDDVYVPPPFIFFLFFKNQSKNYNNY